MNTLQERLSGARQKAGLTQAQLAARAGVSQSTIAQIESGRNSGTKFAFRLANALQVSVEWLLAGKGIAEIPTDGDIDDVYNFQAMREGVSINLTEPRTNPNNEDEVIFDFTIPGAALFDRSFFGHHGVAPENCRLWEIKASDMEPYLFADEWVLVNTVDTAMRNGDIVAFLFPGDNLVVRQVSRLPEGGLRLKMFRYPNEPYDVPADKVTQLVVLGKVIYRSGPQIFQK